MGFIQKDAFRTMIINYLGLLLGYLNKGILFVLILSTEEIGLVNLILSVGLLFAQLANLGAINAIAKFLPFFKDDSNRKQSFLIFNLFFVFGGIILFTAVVILLQNQIIEFYTSKSKLFVEYYFWVIPIGIANVLFLVFESYLKSIFKNILAVLMYEFFLRLCITLLLTILAFDYINFKWFFILHCLVYFIPSLVLFIYLLRLNELKIQKTSLKISRKFKKIIFTFSLFSYSNTIGALLVMTLDALMIAYYLGLKETGVYTTIIYLTSALQIPFKSLFRITSPLIPLYWREKNLIKMKEIYTKVSTISLIIGLFMFSLVWLSRNEIFAFLPNEYLQGIWVFLFLMIGRVFDMYSGLNAIIFITSKKYKYDLIFTLSLPLLVFFLNNWLIPLYGITGAAISTGLGLVLSNLGRMIFVFFSFKLHPLNLNQLWIFLIFVITFIILEFVALLQFDYIFKIFVNSFCISILFLGSIYLLKLEPEINNYVKKGFNFVFKKSIK